MAETVEHLEAVAEGMVAASRVVVESVGFWGEMEVAAMGKAVVADAPQESWARLVAHWATVDLK